MTNITRKPWVRLDTYLGSVERALEQQIGDIEPRTAITPEHAERIDQRVEHIRELLNTLGILRIMAKKVPS